MKAIQVPFDESLLAQLDAKKGVQSKSRSAALEVLERRRKELIAKQYSQGYRESSDLGEELEGWEEQGEWPPE